MTERKVLNKYFPPDYDPSKIPRLPRGKRNRVFNLRTMAPFNMRCLTCKTYIYKARKFNSRMEPVDNEDYLGLRIYRFYIRCTSCCSEISWKTDIANNDYVLESGAIRIFEATRTAYKMAIEKVAQEAEEEKNNPMKLLENRTKQSKNEMDALETLEDLKDQNMRHGSLETAERALDALSARTMAKARNEEAEIEAETQKLLEEQSAKRLQKEASVGFRPSVLVPKKKRKMSNPMQGIVLKKKSNTGDTVSQNVASEESKSETETKSEEEAKTEEESVSVPETTGAPCSSLAGLVHYSDSDGSNDSN